ncbi:hypothetical protein [Klebsiella aerogenes]|uniref:hypothetical protein n=1 Tax=Klebsiella aerogenes TaxID=548 RepID=UPI001BD45596|nr:hypothetical protein [Klebsiella aerogenes]
MSAYKSISQVQQAISNIKCFIDPNESSINESNIDSFIIYDIDGDVIYRYLKDKKCFFENSPAFKHKRAKRDTSQLTLFDAGLQFQWSTVFP